MASDTSPEFCKRPWLDTVEAAEYLRLSPGSLRTFRSRGEGPPYHKAGRAVRYRRDELDAYVIGEGPR
ncbi:MAG: helix-turn-helix domain-containing protein [Sphingomonadales bacterium]|nr:helix-turn-helix domain-containing protein [Sphingomonadales bacterium]